MLERRHSLVPYLAGSSLRWAGTAAPVPQFLTRSRFALALQVNMQV